MAAPNTPATCRLSKSSRRCGRNPTQHMVMCKGAVVTPSSANKMGQTLPTCSRLNYATMVPVRCTTGEANGAMALARVSTAMSATGRPRVGRGGLCPLTWPEHGSDSNTTHALVSIDVRMLVLFYHSCRWSFRCCHCHPLPFKSSC